MIERDWYGCYSEGWTGLIVPDAFAHPAKFARGLIRRIYEHAFERGWFQAGDTIVDPFAGVALGALHAQQRGLHWMGVELEQPFIDMGRSCDCTGISKADWVRFYGRWERARYLEGRYWCPRCIMQARNVIAPLPQETLFDPRPPTASYVRNSGKIPSTAPHHYEGNLEEWDKLGLPGTATLLQGDSRELARVLGRAAAGSVSSPPYSSIRQDGGRIAKEGQGGFSAYTNEPPDYWHTQRDQRNLGNLREPQGDHAAVVAGTVSSPPYAGSIRGQNDVRSREEREARGGKLGGGQINYARDYGSTDGQLAALPEGEHGAALAQGSVSSPPWENSTACEDPNYREERLTPGGPIYNDYGNSAGQLGQEAGDTFWTAARTIMEQLWLVLAPGAHAIWVVKSFVRNKQRVDFPGQWRELGEACGFETVERIRAHLVEGRGAQFTLEGDLDERQVERKSFFRRLAERKGSPRIDYEIVLVQKKPPISRPDSRYCLTNQDRHGSI